MRKDLSLIIFLVTILIIGLLFIVSKNRITLKNKAAEKPISPIKQTEEAVPTYLVIGLVKKPKENKIEISSVNAYKNIRHSVNKIYQETEEAYLFQQIIDQQVVSTTEFVFNDMIMGVPPREKNEQHDLPIILDNPQALITVRHYPNSAFQIVEKKSRVIYAVNKQNKVNQALKNVKVLPKKASIASADDNYLDILFISSHYTDFDLFHNDVRAMADFMKSIAPFSEYANRIRTPWLDNRRELDCRYEDRLIPCNYDKVFNAAIDAGMNFDTIVVIENNNTYGGAGYRGANLAVIYRDIDDDAKQVLVHEFGHSFGNLYDEYDYGVNSDGKSDIDAINCSASSSCEKWSGVLGTGCYSVCSYTNWFSPVDNCIMRTLWNTDFSFDPVDEPSIRGSINSYAPITIGSVFIEPTPSQKQFIWQMDCVDKPKTCLLRNMIRPAYINSYRKFCADRNYPYACYGYVPGPTQIPIPTDCPQEEVVQDTNPQSINTYCSATVGSQCVPPYSWSTSLTCHHAQGLWAPFGPSCTNPYCEGCKCTKCEITNIKCSIGTQNKWVALRWDLENYNSNYKVIVSKSGEIVSESKYGEPLKMVYNPEECQNYVIICQHRNGDTSNISISKGCSYTPGESCQ